jgi:hypothetical protein
VGSGPERNGEEIATKRRRRDGDLLQREIRKIRKKAAGRPPRRV